MESLDTEDKKELLQAREATTTTPLRLSNIRLSTRMALLLAAVIGLAGCPATVSVTKTSSWERIPDKEDPAPPIYKGARAEINGEILHVYVDQYNMRRLTEHEIEHEERESRHLGQEFEIGSALAVGGGLLLLKAFHDFDTANPKTEAEKQEQSQTAHTELFGGAALLAVSPFVLGHGVYTSIRAIDRNHETGKQCYRDEIASTEKAEGAEIFIKTSRGNFSIGITDLNGHLQVNLATIIDRDKLVDIIFDQQPIIIEIPQTQTAPYLERVSACTKSDKRDPSRAKIDPIQILPKGERNDFERYKNETNMERKIITIHEFMTNNPRSSLIPRMQTDLNSISGQITSYFGSELTRLDVEQYAYFRKLNTNRRHEFLSAANTLFVNFPHYKNMNSIISIIRAYTEAVKRYESPGNNIPNWLMGLSALSTAVVAGGFILGAAMEDNSSGSSGNGSNGHIEGRFTSGGCTHTMYVKRVPGERGNLYPCSGVGGPCSCNEVITDTCNLEVGPGTYDVIIERAGGCDRKKWGAQVNVNAGQTRVINLSR